MVSPETCAFTIALSPMTSGLMAPVTEDGSAPILLAEGVKTEGLSQALSQAGWKPRAGAWTARSPSGRD